MLLLDDGGLYNNLAATILILIYVKTTVAVCDYSVKKGILAPDVSRKIVHLAASSIMIWWPLFDSTHWSWILNITVPVVFMIQLFVKGAGLIQIDANDPDVRSMSRTGDPRELLYGPLFFTLILNVNGTLFFMKPASVYIMAAVGYGDGIAPLVGQRYPIHQYRCPGGIKSMGGSLAVFLSTIGGFFVLRYMVGIPVHVHWIRLLAVASTATIVEGLSPGDFDNLALSASTYLTLVLVGGAQ